MRKALVCELTPLLFASLVAFGVLLMTEAGTLNGGWHISGEQRIGFEGPCTIERVDGRGFTQEAFLERYAFTKPVIIYNINNESFQQRCEKDVMLEEWRDTPIVLNSANTYSYTRVDSTLGDYVNNILKQQDLNTPGSETLYLFGDIDQTVWKPLLDEYAMPKWTVPKHEPALSFGIAGAGTGVPFHFHGPGFGEVIHGSKVQDYPVVMFTKPACGYCTLARDLLNKENILFREKDLDLISATNPDGYQAYINGLVYTTRQTSVPQIFICGKFIGGFTQLNKLHESKKLLEAVEKCSDQYDPVVF